MMEWYTKAMKKYEDFGGRAQRAEYWYFGLVSSLILVAFYIAQWVVAGGSFLGTFIVALGMAYSIAILVPSFAVLIRRLHDTNRSGWWMCIGFVPLIGSLVLLVFLVQDGDPGTNRFGPNPKLSPATT